MAFRFESPLLHAYWISFPIGHPYHFGMGVTAFDEHDAIELLMRLNKGLAVDPKAANIRELTSEDQIPYFGSSPFRYATSYFRGVWNNNTGFSISGDERRIGCEGN